MPCTVVLQIASFHGLLHVLHSLVPRQTVGRHDNLATLQVQVAYFVNSGSEANDMALMMARLYSGNYDVLALRNCYHGMSEGTMGVTAHSTWKFNVPQVPNLHS